MKQAAGGMKVRSCGLSAAYRDLNPGGDQGQGFDSVLVLEPLLCSCSRTDFRRSGTGRRSNI